MAKGITQPVEQIINGSFGEMFGYDLANGSQETLFLGEVQQISARITKNYRETYLSGTRKMKQKLMGVGGEGSIRRFKINSDFLRLVGNTYHRGEGTGQDPVLEGTDVPNSIVKRSNNANGQKHHNIDFRCSLIITLDDPESVGTEQVRLLGVKLREVPLGWQVNEVVEEEIPFVFEDIEFITAMVQDRPGGGYNDFYAARYEAQRNL